MFYQYSDELTTIEPQDRDPNLVCAAYITLAELDAHYEKFGFSPSTVQQCKEENRYFRSNIEVYDDYSFGTLKITDAANARAREDCLAFYVKKIKENNKEKYIFLIRQWSVARCRIGIIYRKERHKF